MGPRTGPLPASSTPSAHAGPGIVFSLDSVASGLGVGWRDGGTVEKWVYDAPVKRRSGFTDGAMNTSAAGVSRTTSSSICESAIVIFDCRSDAFTK